MQLALPTRKAATAAAAAGRCCKTAVRPVVCRAATYKLTLDTPNGTKEIVCKEGKSVLEAALAANIELPNLCHTGTCGACSARVVAGDMDPLESYLLDDSQRDMGYTLLCCTHPRSDMTIKTHQESAMYTQPYGI